MNKQKHLTIIGGGLAGCEAAWQAACRNIKVDLYEMRPIKKTGAHTTSDLSELVCSNSLGSNLIDRASGLLKQELRMLNSLLIECADRSSVPAGGALAVDRKMFSSLVESKIRSHKNVTLIREEVKSIPNGISIIASGPLTSKLLIDEMNALFGENNLYFFDAIAPIITSNSINMNIAFKKSRYDRNSGEDGDYINCPFTSDQYYSFLKEIINAKRIQLKSFENEIINNKNNPEIKYFESCLPIEIIAKRGMDALSYGPMRPVGLNNPVTNKRYKGVVQLRQDDIHGDFYNIVGFQTNLTFSEQKRIFRMIPGLENAEFVRYGQMHRNTYVNSPKLLQKTLQCNTHPNLFFAGQITGVEGYVGSIATGLVAGINASSYLEQNNMNIYPKNTMLASLINYITDANIKEFHPMKANFGILSPFVNKIKSKRERAQAYSDRSLSDLQDYLLQNI